MRSMAVGAEDSLQFVQTISPLLGGSRLNVLWELSVADKLGAGSIVLYRERSQCPFEPCCLANEHGLVSSYDRSCLSGHDLHL